MGAVKAKQTLTHSDVLRGIVQRTDLEVFTDRVLDSFWYRPEFQRLHPPRDDVRAWVRWNLDLVIRWLVDGQPPSEAEIESFRNRARERAIGGTPADIVPANFRRAARFAWAAILDAATDEERLALVDSADLLFQYVDRVSGIFSEVYEATATSSSTTIEETSARALLQRIAADEAPLPEDHQLAERIGFEIERASSPFVIASPRLPAEHHTKLAAQLRRRQALAASEGRRVVGLANGRSPWRELELDSFAVVASGPAAIRGERWHGMDELRTAVEVAITRGHRGEVAVENYLPDLLLRRSPRVANQIRARIYGPLTPELERTLDLLVERNFERAATAAALPVHRNTLRDRINRISEITGVDLECAHGRGMAWLAWLQKHETTTWPTSGSAIVS